MEENRKWVVIGVFCFVALIYLARLFYIQVLDDTYSLGASKNSINRVIETPYRGQIYDRNHKLLVDNTPVYDLYVTPKKVIMADTAAFCTLMNLSKADFDSLMGLAKNYSMVKPSLFKRRLSKQDFARLQDALVDYRGFHAQINSVRIYPGHTLANTLGYVSEINRTKLDEQEYPYYRPGDYIGQSGLESYYEEQLRGRRGVKFMMQDVHGVTKGSWKGGAYDTLAVKGKDLLISVDSDLQRFADSLMVNKVGAIVAIEPATGEILASVSAPTFDPNLLSASNFSNQYGSLLKNRYKPLINRPIMASYRPGSTFKLIQALVAQQEGTLTPHTVYGHAGSPMRCHCRGGNDLRGAIGNSCNPYFYQVFRRMLYNNSETNTFKASAVGLAKWHQRVEQFGIGQQLGVDLPSERRGNLPDVPYYDRLYKGENRWKFSYISSLSIGEGELLITPLKLANLAAAIANRGWYITPHYLKGFETIGAQLPDQYRKHHDTGIDHRYYLPVIDGMRRTVVSGSAKSANLAGLDICGKTGTSQNTKYGHQFDHSIFVGFAPMNAPTIAVAVFVENAGWGGDVAAPIAALVVERYIKGRTETKWLANRLRAARYLPPIGGIRAYKKAAPVKRDTTPGQRRDPVNTPQPLRPKPLLTTVQPSAVGATSLP
ncbi:penicillin-binding transpeptidase domain-containing protein [Spirosoma agri]|uniref:Peptidoglycan glycosyltransferase n=1 Tax=Spirosoma agri TaxID=1987381 RepID=A0A6M0IR36_9BACT|nr:penicillin-binding transpeptidase domain-containing protein [Spirosoma agri]NEU70422.1 peptidoglycan glycosyltransferase [Spirosoma agri]